MYTCSAPDNATVNVVQHRMKRTSVKYQLRGVRARCDDGGDAAGDARALGASAESDVWMLDEVDLVGAISVRVD